MKNPLAFLSQKKQTQELAVVDDSNAMITMIGRVAMDPNADVEKMEKLLDMQERIFDKNAEKAFNSAMVECQIEMGSIRKTSWNDQTKSFYAKLEVIVEDIKPVYTSHGFCLCFSHAECPKPEWIRIQCEVSHIGGYSKLYWMDLPPDGHGIKGSVNKTPVHAVASTDSYGKRYVTVNIFNIVIIGADQDGNQNRGQQESVSNTIREDQVKELENLISKCSTTAESVCTQAGISELSELRKEHFVPAKQHIIDCGEAEQ